MALHTHLVVAYNHETKQFSFDQDGTQFWIRELFPEETSTWSDEQENYVEVPVEVEEEAIEALGKLGIGAVSW
jgi:hypothetical protein